MFDWCGKTTDADSKLPGRGEKSTSAGTQYTGRHSIRLTLVVLAYNLGDFLQRLALPGNVRHWSLRRIQVKLIKIGAKVVRHARQVICQMREVAVSWELFEQVLARICALAPGVG